MPHFCVAEDIAAGAACLLDGIAQQLTVVDMDQIEEIAPDHVVRRVAEHLAEGRIGLQDVPAVRLDQHFADRALLEDAPEKLFALPQCAGVRLSQPFAAPQIAAHQAEDDAEQNDTAARAEHN